jgi:SAM-dependent methyltransferase
MTAADHLALLRGAIAARGGTWADLGAGDGAFTRALADLIGPEAAVYSVDTDSRALGALEREMRSLFPSLIVRTIHADFTKPLDFPPLDGIVMANSLHFQRYACAVLAHAGRWLKPDGKLVVVEYDMERPSPWVPYPLSPARLTEAAACAGLAAPRLLATRPSRYNGSVYSAVLSPPRAPSPSA